MYFCYNDNIICYICLGIEEPCVDWADSSGSWRPGLDAYVAGRQEDDMEVCIGRALVGGGTQPGTYLPNKGLVIIPFDGKVFNETRFQFLVHKSSRKCG